MFNFKSTPVIKKLLLSLTVCTLVLPMGLRAQQLAAPAETKKGWGYIRPDSSWLIEPYFTDYWRGNVYQFNSDDQLRVMGDYHEGMLRVRIRGGWGYYNSEGKLAIALQYTGAKNFSESLAAVREKRYWGFINKKGEWVIQPKYDEVGSFNNGLAKVQVDGKWGFINHDGNIVIPCVYRTVKRFTQGMAAVEIENNQWTYIDTTGKTIMQELYSNAYPFNEGMARVITNGSDGFIDANGKLVIPCKYEVAASFSEGICRVKDGRWLFLDKQGNRLGDKEILNANDFHDGMCVVRTRVGWGYLNTDGSWAIEASARFEGAGDFCEGIGRVRIGDTWKFIDKKGNVLFPQLDFDRAESFSMGYARINAHEGWGAINKSGQVVIQPQFKHMYSFVDVGDSSDLGD